jgi:hypothetical protein
MMEGMNLPGWRLTKTREFIRIFWRKRDFEENDRPGKIQSGQVAGIKTN